MLEEKTTKEVFHYLVKVHTLSGDGLLEACDYFTKVINLDELNIDEKEIMACCLLNIRIAAAGREKSDEIEEKRQIIRDFYYANYDNVAEGTRDYMNNYEKIMNKEKEMFKGLHEFVEKNYSKQLKK